MRKLLIGFLLVITCLNLVWASEERVMFDAKLGTQKLNSIHKNLPEHATPAAYLGAIDAINELIKQAVLCTEDTQKEINDIDILIKQGKKVTETTNSADLVYLEQQKKKWSNIQAECRLFTIVATERVEDYKHTLIVLREKATLSRSMPIWTLLQTLKTSQPPSIQDSLSKVFSYHSLSLPYLVISLCASLAFSLLFLTTFRKTPFSIRYLHFKRVKLSDTLVLALTINALLLLTPLLFEYVTHENTDPLITPLVLCTLYFISWVALIFVFKIKSIRSFLNWYNFDYHFARAAIFIVLTAFFTAALGEWSSEMQLHPPMIWQLLKTAYLYTLIFICLSYINYYCRATAVPRPWIERHALGVKISATMLLSIPLVLGSMGYLTLSLQLLYAGFVLLTILFFMTTLILGFEKLYHYLYEHAPLKQRMMLTLGYKPNQTFTEFLILKIAIQLIILIFGLFLIVKATGFSTDTIERAYDQFVNGIHIANMIFYPTRILLGIVVFCLLYLSSRAISTKISGHQQFEDEEETQVAVASLLTYVGFSIAFVVGSLIAGFDFTGLAIIAGALSVGIGLGLQSIVNNFVSGLIILIEKPIKPGDRIAIGGVEGVVKKIRVRSTQITTAAREDIIIPNSDLITQRVVNFMLTNKYCRITFDIEVAYGSDTHLVRDTLLEIANQHDEVIKSERHKPSVFFSNFAENGLMFQLTCLLRDVNKKLSVRSDINFEIDRVFRERQIEMPFAQREVHIRSSDLKKLY